MRLTAVQDVVTRPGPFVTVHAEVGRTTEDARQQLESRWTTIRHALEAEQVEPAVVERIGELLQELPGAGGEARRTIVAAGGEVLFADTQHGAGHFPEAVEVGPLPDLAPWVAHAGSHVPFALAVCDHEGADVSFHTSVHDRGVDADEVGGRTLHEHQVPSHMAERQYQRHSEQTYRHNAEDVAEALRRGVGEHGCRVVVLAGGGDARRLVEAGLDGLQVEVVHVEDGGRAQGSSEEALWTGIEAALASLQAQEEAEVLEQLGTGEGQAGTGCRGLDDVLDAFVRGQVDRLLVDLQAARELTVDPAAHPGLPLPDDLGEVPADRVLVALAAATQADVVTVPAAQTDGEPVSAVLRWDNRTTPAADTV
ncbi:hypothetical protein [Nocardioides perillae]|uniref:Peptide chain release factor 1 n=1 Tax=Nocardioides perillae TaxID=1119534 RepID=A0A7Y9UJA0_9ACTN|nr:hypothetical protein [Nocardioides perillae]NYG54013.1 hypothetical protein [Nocardioides perillae]